ncbi:conserved hypothetical protein [Pediculus humanus corporis]|uniref:Protein takeout n=1 Tax=Pediculus humanus subsp. corporis TaxID=121224 RepID=E0VNY3_PEDHC|nr:uncharacterized protein Phum_PHUM347600 [Pediculus humanus corporis]EEB15089.1 conserved hypothetical protein [Pediculus humanus corporis]
MNIDQSNQPISLKLKLIDTIHTGLSTLNFHSASIDTINDRWILNGTLPYYSLHGKYKGNGKLLLLPIIGEGNANFTYLDTKVDFVMDGRRKKEKGEIIIFNLIKLKVYFTFDKCFVTITNLFSGNKQLSDAVNHFIGNNSKEVMNGVKSSLEKIYSSLYYNMINKLISDVPYTEIFKNA